MNILGTELGITPSSRSPYGAKSIPFRRSASLGLRQLRFSFAFLSCRRLSLPNSQAAPGRPLRATPAMRSIWTLVLAGSDDDSSPAPRDKDHAVEERVQPAARTIYGQAPRSEQHRSGQRLKARRPPSSVWYAGCVEADEHSYLIEKETASTRGTAWPTSCPGAIRMSRR